MSSLVIIRSYSPFSMRNIYFLAIVILALLVVGWVSHTVTRHIIRILPLVGALSFSIRKPQWSSWVALPLYTFWLLIMALIWLFLFGVSRIITGSFSSTEIAMTILIGISCGLGILNSYRTKSAVKLITKIVLFVWLGILQILAMWLSFIG